MYFKTCARFSSRLYSYTSSQHVTTYLFNYWDMYGVGGGGGAGQHRRYNGIHIYIMYISYVLLLLSLIQVVDWLQLV